MKQDWLIHNSQLPTFRSPFGAVSCHSTVTIALAVTAGGPPVKVTLRLWQSGHGEERIPMTAAVVKNGYLYYQAAFAAPEQPGWLWYYFIIEEYDGRIWFYGNNQNQLGGEGQISPEIPPSYQITVYERGLSTPAWFKDKIMYQIFVDRFADGNAEKQLDHAPPGSVFHTHWDNNPVYIRDMQTGSILAYDFFGGNLAGVINKLPYLQQLGIGVIYFNPLFQAPSNHKYDTADYKTIDALFGDNELFRLLCEKAKEAGIAVILDGVFSHTGSDSIYFNRSGTYPSLGAYQSPQSPYYNWYRFKHWPDDYESWWGIETLPNVEETDASYQQFIIEEEGSVVEQWAELGAKGWRLDVADELPDEFIEKFRQKLKQLDPEAVLIGEVWEDASHKESYGRLRPYLLGQQLDSVMNYPFRKCVLDFLLGSKTAGETQQILLSIRENYPKHHFYSLMNLIGSHDVPRILTLLGDEEFGAPLTAAQLAAKRLTPQQYEKAAARLKAAVLWQMTFPGVPSVYYGDEAGVEGYTDPLNRRTYPWGREDRELLTWFSQLTRLRNAHAVLRTGDWIPLEANDDVLAFVRYITGNADVFQQERDDNTALVLVNRSDRDIMVSIDVRQWVKGRLLYDMMNEEQEVAVGDGTCSVVLPPFGSKVLLERLYCGDKTCGVLLHPTSLPSTYGIGDFGPEAYHFIDFLEAAGQKLWQILPLTPVGFGDSPYAALSAFAGNWLLLSPELLAAEGLVTEAAIAKLAAAFAGSDAGYVDYDKVKVEKEAVLRQAFTVFTNQTVPASYREFCLDNKAWLPDYALFMAAGRHFNDLPWNEWEPALAAREEAVMEHYRKLLSEDVAYHTFLQYLFYRQWQAVKQYANHKGIQIVGDMPIFVAHHSSDVWANQRLFELGADGKPLLVAGVPPDYFSETGQLWGNPLYRWDVMAQDDYTWWRERFACLLRQVDIVRLDHFRGFESYWEISAAEKTAVNGRWVKGPGAAFFTVLEKYLGPMAIIAEDLGIITQQVIDLKQAFAFPGMQVLHFSFTCGLSGQYQPLGIEYNTVLYTGTHDNNTTVGWYREQGEGDSETRNCVDKYLGITGLPTDEELCWRLIELAYQSRAKTVIIPMQDLLHLDASARMNYPGTVGGRNWRWRCHAGCPDGLVVRLREFVQKYHR
ncbi:4-alpha-glucanotransferase [Anaerospora hongkongensis]|uniref:4-alpha-glucanotransferase n=1 Tax=Anaerospora hongkongensis TaxID=244830 RepID=UPI002897F065|nr:4-alpha-glucanotransferase [Anaerospora hongkongensis]